MDAPEPVLVPVLPRRPRRRWPVVLLPALVLVSIAAYLAWQVTRPALAEVPDRLAIVDPEGRLVTMDELGGARTVVDLPGVDFAFPAWSPDGGRIAAIGSDSERAAVYVLPARPDQGEITVIYSSPDQRPFYLSWSPDGERITFLTSQPDGIALRVAPADGDSQAAVVRRGAPLYWDWVDPARLLVHTGSHGPDAFLGEVDLHGTTLDAPTAAPGFFRAPGVSALGTHRAWIGPGDDTGQAIHLEPRDGSAGHRIPVEGSVAMTWDPNGTRLAFIASDRPTLDPPPLPIGALRVVDAADGTVRTLIDGPVMAFFWSPDGRTLAALEFVEAGDDGPIEASRDRRVAAVGGFEGAAPADPNGLPARLLFVDVATAEVRSDRRIRLSDLFAFQVLPFFDQYALSHRLWSPDSSSVVLPVADGGEPDRLVVLAVDGGDPQPLADGSIAFWSP